jgi:pyruvate,water dikinase
MKDILRVGGKNASLGEMIQNLSPLGIKVPDGFSIGSNDLTQLTLGLDRDSALVANVYDERNPDVKRSISNLIKTAKEFNVKVGICGQGPSDLPDFARFLADEGIDSISVTPNSVLKTLKALECTTL